jgi:hypothetical protein
MTTAAYIGPSCPTCGGKGHIDMPVFTQEPAALLGKPAATRVVCWECDGSGTAKAAEHRCRLDLPHLTWNTGATKGWWIVARHGVSFYAGRSIHEASDWFRASPDHRILMRAKCEEVA